MAKLRKAIIRVNKWETRQSCYSYLLLIYYLLFVLSELRKLKTKHFKNTVKMY